MMILKVRYRNNKIIKHIIFQSPQNQWCFQMSSMKTCQINSYVFAKKYNRGRIQNWIKQMTMSNCKEEMIWNKMIRFNRIISFHNRCNKSFPLIPIFCRISKACRNCRHSKSWGGICEWIRPKASICRKKSNSARARNKREPWSTKLSKSIQQHRIWISKKCNQSSSKNIKENQGYKAAKFKVEHRKYWCKNHWNWSRIR